MRENNLIWNRKTFDLCRNVCLQELVKLTFTHKLQINYLQKDNWAYLLKCWHATHHVKFYTCNNSTPKGIPACVGASKCDHMPFIDKPAWSASENFLLFWTIFCPFTSLTTLKIKFLKKWKKKAWRYHQFTHVYQKQNVKLSWNFSATSPGKGPVDGVGATLKRHAMEKNQTRKVTINADEFYQAVRDSNIKVTLINSTELQKYSNRYSVTLGLYLE